MTQKCLEDRELNQARSKLNTVDQPVRTARTFVHHYNSTQYCSTESVLFNVSRPTSHFRCGQVEARGGGNGEKRVKPVSAITLSAETTDRQLCSHARRPDDVDDKCIVNAAVSEPVCSWGTIDGRSRRACWSARGKLSCPRN